MRRHFVGRQVRIYQQHLTTTTVRVTQRALLTTTVSSSLHPSSFDLLEDRRHSFSQQPYHPKIKEDNSFSSSSSLSLQQKLDLLLHNDDTTTSITPQMMEFGHTTLKWCSTKPNMGDTAEALLERLLVWMRDPAKKDDNVPPPDRIVLWYRWVMRAWALTTMTPTGSHHSSSSSTTTTRPYSVFRAHQLLERMQTRHAHDPQHHPAPDITVYDAFLYACATTTTPFSEPVLPLALSLIRHMEQTGTPYPSTVSYNHVLSMYTQQAPSYGAASAAEDWLLHISEQSVGTTALPDTRSFNRVLHAWTQSGAPDRAYAILQFMMQQGTEKNQQIQPDPVSFATVLHGYRTTHQPEMAEQVFQEALEYFVHRPTRKEVDLTPCLDAAMMAWAYSDRSDAAERVQALLRDAYLVSWQTMHGATCNNLEHAIPTTRIQLEPTAATHRICLHAYLRDGVEGVDAATRHLYEIIAACRSSPETTRKPSWRVTATTKNSILTTGAFHVVLQGWLESDRPEAPEQGRLLLQLMMELSSEPYHLPCAPETSTFIRVLQILKKHKKQCPPQQALDVLEQAEQRRMINFYVYKLVLQILERSPSYAFVAYEVLQRALAQHRKGSIQIESSALHRLTMDVLLKHQTRESLDLALHVLLHEFPEQSSVGALELSYVSVLRACGRFPARAGPVAWELYEHMTKASSSSLIRHHPNVWNAVMQTLFQSPELQYVEKACHVLQEMVLHPDIVGPDRSCMDECILSLLYPSSREGIMKKEKKKKTETDRQQHDQQQERTDRAIPLFLWLVEQYQQGTLQDCPSLSTFRSVFDACHDSQHHKDDARRIQTLARHCFPPKK